MVSPERRHARLCCLLAAAGFVLFAVALLAAVL